MPIEYVIPIFQRRYVWNRKRQWEKLWADVKRTAEFQLSSPNSTREHFLGAIIVRAESPAPGGVAKWSVIDGQQRLTTFQLLLDAAELALREVGERTSTAAAQLNTLIENPPAFRNPNDPHSWLKLKPGGSDLQLFAQAMSRGSGSHAVADDDLIGQGHEYFRTAVNAWLTEGPAREDAKANALTNTLLHKLRLVSITVDSTDHPNWIFETLNARGTPLQAWDLVKNYLLFEERDRGGSDIALYQNHFQPIETDKWWSTQTQSGAHDIDLYLFYWLTMRAKEKVSLANVYSDVQEYASDRIPSDVAADIAKTAGTYRMMTTGGFGLTVDEHLRRWHGLDIAVTTPLVLWLLENTSGKVLERSLRAIESFFVRRMVCGIGVQGLNNWFPRLIRHLEVYARGPLDDELIKAMSSSPLPTRQWPDDSQFGQALTERPIYQSLSPRSRLRTILESIEIELGKGQVPVTLKDGLTIEHMMPQNWRKHYSLRHRSPDALRIAEEERDRLIHTIGNLTLSTSSLGSKMSDGPWSDKKKALEKYGLMMLTNDALNMEGRGWGDQKIKARSLRLANFAIDIWPPPDRI